MRPFRGRAQKTKARREWSWDTLGCIIFCMLDPSMLRPELTHLALTVNEVTAADSQLFIRRLWIAAALRSRWDGGVEGMKSREEVQQDPWDQSSAGMKHIIWIPTESHRKVFFKLIYHPKQRQSVQTTENSSHAEIRSDSHMRTSGTFSTFTLRLQIDFRH